MAADAAPQVRQATTDDMPAVAEVYLSAFPDSLRDLGLQGVRPGAVADVMAICLAAEPEGFLVATIDGSLAGYVICPADVGRMRGAGLRRMPGIAWRWLTGRYGVGLRAVIRLAREKLMFWGHADLPGADCPARILSIAVHPRGQGHGLGTALMAAALDYLRGRGASCVRLEVRPDNAAAHHIYEKLGFRDVGQVHDTRGPWDVMLLELGSPDG